ncbi:unnamed protein product, partial [Coccothraustes coccothraustes]
GSASGLSTAKFPCLDRLRGCPRGARGSAVGLVGNGHGDERPRGFSCSSGSGGSSGGSSSGSSGGSRGGSGIPDGSGGGSGNHEGSGGSSGIPAGSRGGTGISTGIGCFLLDGSCSGVLMGLTGFSSLLQELFKLSGQAKVGNSPSGRGSSSRAARLPWIPSRSGQGLSLEEWGDQPRLCPCSGSPSAANGRVRGWERPHSEGVAGPGELQGLLLERCVQGPTRGASVP